MKKHLFLIILIAASISVHFVFFGHPNETVFDEVHFGIVFRLLGDSDKIKIKEDKHALSRLATLGECFSHYQEMEGWSQIVLDFLKKEKNGA